MPATGDEETKGPAQAQTREEEKTGVFHPDLETERYL